MNLELGKPPRGSIPIQLSSVAQWPAHRASLDAAGQRWADTLGFRAAADTHLLLPDAEGRLQAVWVGVERPDHPWALAAFPPTLPAGTYHLGTAGLPADNAAAALSWALGGYRFDVYKTAQRQTPTLTLPSTADTQRALILAHSIAATRDLVNTPAEHLGPEELAAAVSLTAKAHGARVRQIVGDQLLKAGFPAIHAVGRAAARAPRLIELTWGRPKHPLVTLVGKGVCFDTGGLDIKGAEGMRLMKKDMGGAANALGLAQMIMALRLPLRLRLLIPAVENAIAGNAYRPGDVFKTRSGLHIEIGNTDAEGRVILCDALSLAAEKQSVLLIDMATLTGAARVALGPQLPALFCRDTSLARELVDLGMALHDPLWHMPLWQPYHRGIESDIADIVNTGRGTMGGAISAALFLQDFVPAGQPWLHLDLFAWNDAAQPGRPVGGEAQTLRTLLTYLERLGTPAG